MDLPLHGVHGEGRVAKVDDDRTDLLDYEWHVTANGYVYRNAGIPGVRLGVPLHHEITGHKGSYARPVDHINRDRLDNRSENLRVVTLVENLLNRGVYKNNKTGERFIYPVERDYGMGYFVRAPNLAQKTFRTLEEAVEYRNKSGRQ